MEIKYPKSWHLYYSEKLTKGDRKHLNDNHFINKHVTVSIKMDGENSSIYNHKIHARSLDSLIDDEDRRWLDYLRMCKISGNLPDTYRICGENLYYKHTVPYNNLKSYFYVFSIWNDNVCLSIEETKEWCFLLELEMVPIIYSGIYNKEEILKAYYEYSKIEETEGYVIRLSDSFDIKDFNFSLNKFVNKSFVLPPEHWRNSAKTMNKLRENKKPYDLF
jgi:hypothetical protein